MRYQVRCGNCQALALTENDHHRDGMDAANRWLCDTFAVDHDEGEYPNFLLTFDLAMRIQEAVRTSPYKEFRDMGKVFDS